MDGDEIELKVAGGIHGDMFMDPSLTQTGGVPDGVAMRFASDDCSFVVPFADLERAYQAAKEFRIVNADFVKTEVEKFEAWMASVHANQQ
jgi:hypothetical protein